MKLVKWFKSLINMKTVDTTCQYNIKYYTKVKKQQQSYIVKKRHIKTKCFGVYHPNLSIYIIDDKKTSFPGLTETLT